MIRVETSPMSQSDLRKLEDQVQFLEAKVAEKHWPKLLIRPALTIVATWLVYFGSRSVFLSIAVLVVGITWTAAVLDKFRYQRMLRESLAYEKRRLGNPTKTTIRVEDCDYHDFGEVEDEGVLFIFHDAENRWLLLEGQAYYPSDTFPSRLFTLSYDCDGALIDIQSDQPYSQANDIHDSAEKDKEELYFGMLDHAVVHAESLDQAIVRFKELAEKSCL